MVLAVAGDLWQVGNANHLMLPGKCSESLSHHVSGATADPSIHLIKNQGLMNGFLGQQFFQGQDNPGKLSARGDLGHGSGLFARIG